MHVVLAIFEIVHDEIGHISFVKCSHFWKKTISIFVSGGVIAVMMEMSHLPRYESDLNKMASTGKWKHKIDTKEFHVNSIGETLGFVIIEITVN